MGKIHKTHFTAPEMPWKKECDHKMLEFNKRNKLVCLKCKRELSIEEAFPEWLDNYEFKEINGG